MPIPFPIAWNTEFVDKQGKPTPYFQRILEQLFIDAASMNDILGLHLQPTVTLTPSSQDQIDNATNALQVKAIPFSGQIPRDSVRDIALLASTTVPFCPPSSGGGSMSAEAVAALGYWVPVT